MQKYCKIIGAEISNIEKNTLFASLGKMSGEIENWQKSDREILSDFPLNEEKNIIYQGVNSLIMKVEIGIFSKTKKKETRGKFEKGFADFFGRNLIFFCFEKFILTENQIDWSQSKFSLNPFLNFRG